MEERNIFIFLLFLIIPAFNLVIALIYQKKSKNIVLNLWIGIFLFNVLLILGRMIEKKTGEWILILPMIIWGFLIKSFYQLSKNQSLKNERYLIIMNAVSFFMMLLLVLMGFPFVVYSVPLSLSAFFTGIFLLDTPLGNYFSLAKSHEINREATYGLKMLSFFFYLHLLLFPLWQTGFLKYCDESYLITLLLVSLSSQWWGWEQRSKKKFEGDFRSLFSEDFSNFLENFSKNFELGLLAPSITHQIQNPLMIIIAKGHQLQRLLKDSSLGHQEEEVKEKIQEGLDQMMKSGERIKKTLAVYREMIYEQSSDPKENISLKEILDEVMCLCEQRFQNHGVSFRTFEVDNKFIWGNKAQIEEVFFNVFQNSFESIEFLSDKWIETSCRVEGPFLNVLIQDSGNVEENSPDQKINMMKEKLSLFLSSKMMKDLGGEIFILTEKKRPTFLLQFPRFVTSDEFL